MIYVPISFIYDDYVWCLHVRFEGDWIEIIEKKVS